MNKERAIEIIKELNICPCHDSCDIRLRIKDASLKNEINFQSGISKYCLVFKKDNFVVKWSKDDSFDETKTEYQIYQKAIDKKLEMVFPYTDFLIEYNDIKFYIQSKIDFSAYDCNSNDRLLQKYQRITRTVPDRMVTKIEEGFYLEGYCYNRDLDEVWAKMILSIYGKKICKRLCEFIQENKINDLHSANIGYLNNKPVIIDFSGYHR